MFTQRSVSGGYLHKKGLSSEGWALLTVQGQLCVAIRAKRRQTYRLHVGRWYTVWDSSTILTLPVNHLLHGWHQTAHLHPLQHLHLHNCVNPTFVQPLIDNLMFMMPHSQQSKQRKPSLLPPDTCLTSSGVSYSYSRVTCQLSNHLEVRSWSISVGSFECGGAEGLLWTLTEWLRTHTISKVPSEETQFN